MLALVKKNLNYSQWCKIKHIFFLLHEKMGNISKELEMMKRPNESRSKILQRFKKLIDLMSG